MAQYADPVLIAHNIRPYWFDIAGAISPVSIRDQMLRGRLVVERAAEAGLIGPNRALLVVGAGAAGATAAIRAAELDIATRLIDIKVEPFSRQRGCFSRRIDPTVYDWPADHWTTGQFTSGPMHWSENSADILAWQWSLQLDRAKSSYQHLESWLGTTVERAWLSQDIGYGPHWIVETNPAHSDRQFGMILSAVGLGNENCKLGNHLGFRFWDSDPLDFPDLGLDAPPRVVISGGGDGALQDYLRIVCPGARPKQIYESLPEQVKNAVERRIYSLEDQAQRQMAWSTPTHDHEVLSDLHSGYRETVWEVSGGPQWGEVDRVLWGPVKPLDRDALSLLFPCTHFSRSYALNRFLVLLIEEWLSKNFGWSFLGPGWRLVGVSGDACDPEKPGICHGTDHTLTITRANCLGVRGVSMQKTCNVLIVRHGTERPTFNFSAGTVILPRQILPYWWH